MKGRPMYAPLIAIIGSGTAVVTMTFGLFGSVLGDMLPHVEGAAQAVNLFSFGTLIVLLALTLLVRERIGAVAQGAWAVAGLVFLAAAIFTFFLFRNVVNNYVYTYPPNGVQARVLVSGEMHPRGRIIANGADIAGAVAANGGPDIVQRHNVLWTAQARNEVIDRMVRYYAAITFLMTTALYMVAIAVWRSVAHAPAKTRRKAAKHRAAE